MGLVLAVVVHAADVQDRDGARLALMRLVGRFPRLERIWADGAYAGKLVLLGQECWWVDLGVGAASSAPEHFRGHSPPLGRRAHVRMAGGGTGG